MSDESIKKAEAIIQEILDGAGLRWYVAQGEFEYGPFSAEKIRELIYQGYVNVNVDVRTDRHREWEPLSQVPELVPEECFIDIDVYGK